MGAVRIATVTFRNLCAKNLYVDVSEVKCIYPQNQGTSPLDLEGYYAQNDEKTVYLDPKDSGDCFWHDSIYRITVKYQDGAQALDLYDLALYCETNFWEASGNPGQQAGVAQLTLLTPPMSEQSWVLEADNPS